MLIAVREATRSQPIVFFQVSDPVGGGFVENLARPGGNITGFTNFELRWEANGCRRLRKLHPRWNARQSFLDPETSAHAGFLQAAETASVVLQIKVVPLGVRNAEEIEPAIREFALLPRGGMIVAPHPMTRGHFIIDLAARYRLPAIYPFRFYARDGGLISYGIPLSRPVSTCGHICRSHSSWYKTRGPAGPAADQVRACDQS